jgi:hypothetical protein
MPPTSPYRTQADLITEVPEFPEEKWGVSYIDKKGRRVEFITTRIGPPELINPFPVSKLLQIREFRTWRIK